MIKILIITSLMIISISGNTTTLKEKTLTIQDQNEIALTIYNQDIALVREVRSAKLDHDSNRLAWRGVSAKMQPETALFRNLTNPIGFVLQEQAFDYELLTPQKLLEKYTSKKITVIRTNPITGKETREAATVVSSNGGIILRFSDRIETGVPGRLAFPELPQNLRNEPTLIVSFTSSVEGKQDLELSYLTTGLSWQADYIAELSQNDRFLDLSGLVTLTNQSGADYQNAKLQLVAGDLNRILQPQIDPRRMLGVAAEIAKDGAIKNEPLFDYYLYTLPQATTLADNQTKQVALMSAGHIPVNKEFVLHGENYYYSGRHGNIGLQQKIGVFIRFQNTGEGLGIPLPKGIIRVYKKDKLGNIQFIGEEQIDQTPDQAYIRLRLGNAFDLSANKKQTDFQKLAGTAPHSRLFETAFQITLQNAKKEAAMVTIQEPIPGDWNIISESHPHTKVTSELAQWKISIPAKSETTLTYRVRTKL